MPRITFELAEFRKPLSVNTQKLYRAKLNKLAAHGIINVNDLETKQKEVVNAIRTITGSGETADDRTLRRFYLSAVFAAMPALTNKTNPLYRYYQQCTPEGWVRKTKYLPDST